MNIILILTVALVVILLIYYLSKPRDVLRQKPQLQPKPRSLPPVREVQVFLDDITPQVIQVRTKKDLEDEIERAVDRLTAPVDYNQQQLIDTEQRIIDAQKQKVEQLRLEAEREAMAREAEMAAKKKRYDDMLKQKRQELLRRKRKIQEERTAKMLAERERERLNKEKRLAELRLARQKAQQELEAAQKAQSEREKRLKEEELRLLEEARQKAEEDKIKVEEEAAELQKRVEMEEAEARAEEAKFKQQREEAKAEQARMEEEYEAKKAEQALKVEEANAELEELLAAEKERQVQMDEKDKELREQERQKLLLANEAALKELEEAEAEQARMDAEEAEVRKKIESEAAAAEEALLAETSGSQAEYDARVAADQALLDKRVADSENTGDAEQRAERQAALDLEAQSERDASRLSEEEKQREREAAEKLAADSEAGGTVVVEGEPLAFDYDAYLRGDPIPCTVGEWTEWAKVGDLVEETETVEYRSGVRGGRGTTKREEPTGRWQQRWKREREELSPAINGGRCVTEEFKFTTQASRNCEDSDWNEWRNVGEPYEERRGHGTKWYQNQERDRKTAVVPDGCNLRIDTKKKELEPQNCKYSAWGAWTNVGGAYEQTRRGRARRGGGYQTEKTGKWVIKQEATRTVVEQPKYGGATCDNNSLKTTREVVQNPVNCVQSRWGPWRALSDRTERTCTGGRRRTCKTTHYAREKRTRFVSQEPLYGGAGCGPSEEVRETKRDPIACAYSAWSAWRNVGSAYEQTRRGRARRGGGYQQVKTGKWVVKQEATRSIAAQPKYGGAACNNDLLKKTQEVIQNPINCAYGNWGGWVHERDWNSGNNWYRRYKSTRPITQQPLYGGRGCDQSLIRHTDNAIPKVHCAVGHWGGWHSRGGDHVDRRCTGGRRRTCTYTHYELLKRNRPIVRHPAYGGNGCPHTEEHKNVERPKIDCVISWGAWQNDGGRRREGQRRRRKWKQPQIRYGTITRHPAYGGRECGSTTQKRSIDA
uniref:Uncharacterized protein n=1 Tax=Micromonas commoda virus TaxID=3057169 RepID=A0AAU7YNJ6_9PHYC